MMKGCKSICKKYTCYGCCTHLVGKSSFRLRSATLNKDTDVVVGGTTYDAGWMCERISVIKAGTQSPKNRQAEKG